MDQVLRPVLRSFAIVACTLLLVFFTGAAPLEVTKVRVPAAKVGDWFPRGTELRSLAVEEFDSLISEANAGLSARGERPVATLARADHSARWDGGILIGRTILTLSRNRPGAGWLSLGGWSPAVIVLEPRANPNPAAFRSDATGRAGLWIEADSPLTVQVDWRLRARNNSAGRVFSLTLPDAALSELRLDLPPNFLPDLGSAISIGSLATPDGRRVWQFDRIGGAHEIKLRDVVTRSNRPEAKPWVSGPTLVEIDQAGANWTADWSVDLGTDGPRSLDVEVDEGLELLDVRGPRVASFEARREGDRLRVSVKFQSSSPGRETVKILCAAKVPGTGSWKVPAAHPVDAIWVGGSTTIRSDLSRSLSGCRVQSGNLVAPLIAPSPAFPVVISIDPTDSVSVAELTFQKPEGGGRASVAGLIRFANENTRMLAQVRWTLQPGTVPNYVLEVSRGWAINRVELDGEDEPIPWRSESLPGGRTRVTLTAPPLDEQTQTATFNIQASNHIDDPSTPFDLPRVRPVGSLLEDERWVGITKEDEVLRPTFVQSIAWLLPDVVLASSSRLSAGLDKNAHATAWRWLGDDAEARARILPLAAATTTRIEAVASLGRDSVNLSWRISSPRDSSKDGLVVQIEPPLAVEPVWTLTSDPLRKVEAEPLSGLAKLALGLRPQGSAYRLRVPGVSGFSITGSVREPFAAKGRIPLLVVPPAVRAEARLEVRVAAGQLAQFEPADLRPVDLDELRLLPSSQTDGSSPQFRLVSAFDSDGHAGSLQAEMTAGAPVAPGGVIHEAVLSSRIDPGQRQRHRLCLQLSVGQADRLDFELPAGITLSRALRDGQAIEITQKGDRVTVPLVAPVASRSITLDYESELGNADRLAPALPRISLPCASFSWEIGTPYPWIVDAPSEGLRDGNLPRVDRFSFASLSRRATDGVAEAPKMPVQAGTAGVETSLLDLLPRFAEAGKALVVDRLALLEQGIGPRTRVQAGDQIDTAALTSLGLNIVSLPNATMIGSRRSPSLDSDEERAALATRLDDAVRYGADRDDRFQTIERWRDEVTPRSFRSIGTENRISGADDPSRWRTSRYVSAEWPREGATVRIRNVRTDSAWKFIWGCVGFALTTAILSVLPRLRWIALSSLVVSTALVCWFLNSKSGVGISSELLGTVLGLSFRFGRLRGARQVSLRRHLSRSRSSRSPEVFSTQTAVPLLIGLVLVGGPSVAEETSLRILALLPYEQIPTPSERPGRILIRLEDDKRLRALVDSARKNDSPVLSLLDAEHRISRESDGLATIQSRYEVATHGGGRSVWRLPIGDSVEMSATIDNKDAAVSISADRREASIEVVGPGRSSVRILRRVPLRETKGRSTLEVPILAVPSARLSIVGDGRRRSIDVASAHGRLVTTTAGVEGELGPADRIVLRWSDLTTGPSANRGELGAVMLWDAVPSGDSARIRVTTKDPLGTDSLRLALEPGISVRASDIPGLVSINFEGTTDRPEWVARMDPPLPPGAVFELQLWRPIAQARSAITGGAVQASRSPPRFIPLGIDRLTGVVGLRRPGAWTGRLQAKGTSDAFSEEILASLWGPFPDDSLTLAGASRFELDSLITAPIGPAPNRLQARSTLDLVLGEGRIEVSFDSRLQTTAATLAEAELILPEGFSTFSVEADGITARSMGTPGRLGLRFDGTPAKVRQVRIRGFFDVVGVVASTELRKYAKNFGAFQWVGSTPSATGLRVSSRVRFDVEAAAGPSLSRSTEATTGVDPIFPYQTAAQIDPLTSQLSVRWQAQPPRVNVRVRNRVSIGRDRMDWLARLNYDIAGGPLESVYLKIPKAWSEGIRVDSLGDAITTNSETRGDFVYLTVKPEGSAWGVFRLEIAGTRALTSATTLDYPDVTPLGQGLVDKTISVIRANHRRLQVTASGGLVPLDGKDLGEAERLPSGDGRKINSYRVQSEPWSLKMKVESEDSSGTGRAVAGVNQAVVHVTRLEDGSTWGKAAFDVEPIANRVLKVDFNTRVVVPWAVVDGRQVIPLSDEPGSWLIPIDGPTLGRVSIAWRSAPLSESPDAIRIIPMPKLRQPGVPTLLMIAAPESGVPQPAGPSLERIGETAWWVDLAEIEARQIASQASNFDRDSVALRETLVEALADYLSVDEQARLSSQAGGNVEPRAAAARLDEARSSLLETLERVELGDLAAEANSRAGVARKGTAPLSKITPREASEPFRLRQLGEVRRYRLRERNDIVMPLVLWQPNPASAWWTSPGLGPKLLLLGTVGCMVTLVTVASFAVRSRGATILAVGLWLMNLLISPLGAAGALILYLFGRSAPE